MAIIGNTSESTIDFQGHVNFQWDVIRFFFRGSHVLKIPSHQLMSLVFGDLTPKKILCFLMET